MTRDQWEKLVAAQLGVKICPDISRILPNTREQRSRMLKHWHRAWHPLINVGVLRSPGMGHAVFGLVQDRVVTVFAYQYEWSRSEQWEREGFRVLENRVPVMIDGFTPNTARLVEVWPADYEVPSPTRWRNPSQLFINVP